MPWGETPVNPVFIRTFAASLSYCIVSSDGLSSIGCLNCRGALDVHQPDQNEPSHLLATCPECGHWFRIAFSKNETEVIVLELPQMSQITRTPQSLEEGLA
jgi:hypothetical protein